MSDFENQHDDGLAVQIAPPKLKRPPQYKVMLLNDDYTPMDFVVHILQKFFRIGEDAAVQIMLEVHTKGQAVAGVYTKEIAETKVNQVNTFARQNQHPLLCTMEEA